MLRPAVGWTLLLVTALASCRSGEPARGVPSGPGIPPAAPPSGDRATAPPTTPAPSAPRPSWLDENPDGSGLAPSNHGPDEVVAVVDGEGLTMQRLVDNALEWWGDKTLEEMVFRTLLDHRAQAAGIEVSEEDCARRADRWIADLDARVSASGQGSLAELLAKQGETPEGCKAKVVADANFRRQLLLELVLTFDVLQEERVEVQDILVETPEKAKEVLDKLAMKMEFARLAEDESIDVRSGRAGGKIAPFVMGMGPFEIDFDRAAFALSPGEVSQPLHDARRGYHVIRCVSKAAARPRTWAEARDEVWKSLLAHPPTEDEIARWIRRMKELSKDKVEVRWRFGVEESDK